MKRLNVHVQRLIFQSVMDTTIEEHFYFHFYGKNSLISINFPHLRWYSRRFWYYDTWWKRLFVVVMCYKVVSHFFPLKLGEKLASNVISHPVLSTEAPNLAQFERTASKSFGKIGPNPFFIFHPTFRPRPDKISHFPHALHTTPTDICLVFPIICVNFSKKHPQNHSKQFHWILLRAFIIAVPDLTQ